jgi:hypothetical protein
MRQEFLVTQSHKTEAEQITFRQKQATLALDYLGDLSGIGRALAENIIKCYPTIKPSGEEKRMPAAITHGKFSLKLTSTERYEARKEFQKAISRAMSALHSAFDELNAR